MEEKLNALIRLGVSRRATDIHFIRRDEDLTISLRQPEGLLKLEQDVFDGALFEYLKFRMGLDLTRLHVPQSGAGCIAGTDCRFALLPSGGMETGVLRLMQADAALGLEELSDDGEVTEFFRSLSCRRQGLVLFVGPTGSGKTTTLHAILRQASRVSGLKCVSLEDPVEIPDDSYLQIQVDEEEGLTYERGIEELMRHDPDVICIQEVRTASAASRLFTAALTGHFALATIHAGDGRECLWRLKDLGIPEDLILEQLDAVVSQRLYPPADNKQDSGKRKEVCIHEIITRKEIACLLETGVYPPGFWRLQDLADQAAADGRIPEKEARRDFPE
ncbi:ATPase, T2SS/T4P/T4SS family [uncultured Faecalibaculum sp.]|uniref:ATPase, T2SS/T4P/T4SS family n=2 Tax=uncultured Faecalibaculum sp. TaxID=1729681 RepID=UPI0025CD36AD|nr:ATPase, T2SS/T4P/T4SS family [uncultured Faecalibaculum sp.]